ncbi:MAG: nucleotidyl transferase AbiEii/AbiGii toxin family protein [Thermodesulfobacteriota bacterium]|nr:nucleotidyl transferase AbiEii/AbiGii toxin family protein [Thermodesulfobacteriota bacterium]
MLKSKGIITNLQRESLLSFSSIADSQYFYLTGGTALAEFYMGHRLSYDLDLFTTEKGLVVPFSRIMEQRYRDMGFSINVVRRFQTFVEFELNKETEKTVVQLAYDSPFRFEEPVDSDLGVKINDYKDIIVDKTLTFFGRAEPRDAVDLFFILRHENFWQLTELASKKDPGFDLYWMAVALGKLSRFPDNITKWPVQMLVEINVREMKDIFLNFAREIMDKINKDKK